MPRRRTFLRTVGIGSIGAIAGCTGVASNQSATTTTTRSNATTTTNSTETTTTTSTQQSGERYHLSATSVRDDFEDLSPWSAEHGSIEGSDEAFAGSQSLHVTAPKGDGFAWATRDVDWDLSNQTLSLALKVDSPIDNLIVSVRLIAPDTNNVQKMGELVRVRDGQDWFRLDLGTRTFDGSPDLSSVKRIAVGMEAASGAIDFYVDDLRSVDRPEKGYVALTFDDSLRSHYTEAFSVLKEYDMPGTVGVITGNVGDSDSLTIDQMSEMQDAGWEFASHGTRDSSLLGEKTQQMWLDITDAHDWLVSHGFTDGKSAFVYPHGDFTADMIEFAGKYHTMGYRYMDPLSASSGFVTDPMTIGRGNGAYNQNLNKTMVNYAEQFHNLTVFTFHDIGGDGGLSVDTDTFRELVDYISRRNVEVVTVSDIEANLLAD